MGISGILSLGDVDAKMNNKVIKAYISVTNILYNFIICY